MKWITIYERERETENKRFGGSGDMLSTLLCIYMYIQNVYFITVFFCFFFCPIVQCSYYTLKNEYEQGLSDAKSKLGITSTMAEQETRNLFWDMFSRGQGFAKVSAYTF